MPEAGQDCDEYSTAQNMWHGKLRPCDQASTSCNDAISTTSLYLLVSCCCFDPAGKLQPLKLPRQLAIAPNLRPEEIQHIDQGHDPQTNEPQRRHRPRRAHVLKHDNPNMRERRRDDERRNEKRRNRTRRDIRICVGDVAQHALIEQRVAEAEDAAGDDGGPEGGVAVGGEGEPEE